MAAALRRARDQHIRRIRGITPREYVMSPRRPVNDRLRRYGRDEIAGLPLTPSRVVRRLPVRWRGRLITLAVCKSTLCRMQRGRVPYAA